MDPDSIKAVLWKYLSCRSTEQEVFSVIGLPEETARPIIREAKDEYDELVHGEAVRRLDERDKASAVIDSHAQRLADEMAKR